MILRRYQAIFRSRWQALFWAGCVLVSAYLTVRPAEEPAPVAPAKRHVEAKQEQSLDELIAAAREAEDARQEALREAAR